MGVEVDGQWGPYLDCNPDNATFPNGSWSCSNGDDHKNPPNYPDSCSADNFNAYQGYCVRDEAQITKNGIDLGFCCSIAQMMSATHYTHTESNQSCSIYTGSSELDTYKCTNDTIFAFKAGPKPCECDRVYKAVGRENLTNLDDGWYKRNCPAGGDWFSHPKNGECKKGFKVGDGKSNCTYRLEGIAGAINASCMYR